MSFAICRRIRLAAIQVFTVALLSIAGGSAQASTVVKTEGGLMYVRTPMNELSTPARYEIYRKATEGVVDGLLELLRDAKVDHICSRNRLDCADETVRKELEEKVLACEEKRKDVEDEKRRDDSGRVEWKHLGSPDFMKYESKIPAECKNLLEGRMTRKLMEAVVKAGDNSSELATLAEKYGAMAISAVGRSNTKIPSGFFLVFGKSGMFGKLASGGGQLMAGAVMVPYKMETIDIQTGAVLESKIVREFSYIGMLNVGVGFGLGAGLDFNLGIGLIFGPLDRPTDFWGNGFAGSVGYTVGPVGGDLEIGKIFREQTLDGGQKIKVSNYVVMAMCVGGLSGYVKIHGNGFKVSQLPVEQILSALGSDGDPTEPKWDTPAAPGATRGSGNTVDVTPDPSETNSSTQSAPQKNVKAPSIDCADRVNRKDPICVEARKKAVEEKRKARKKSGQ